MNSAIVEAYTSMGYHLSTPRGIFGRASELMSGEALSSGGYREASAEMLFGSASEVCLDDGVAVAVPSIIDTPLYQGLVLLSFIAYIVMLLRSWGFAQALVVGMVGGRDERRMAHEGGELPLTRFKDIALLVGVILVALAAVRIIDSRFIVEASFMESPVVEYMPLLAALLVLVVMMWQFALHRIVGWLTMSDDVSALASITTINFVRMVLLLYPVVSFWLVSPAETFDRWSVVAMVGFALLLIIYLKDIFIFFVEKKIPFLYLILYLCGAILLPLSFIAVLMPSYVS